MKWPTTKSITDYVKSYFQDPCEEGSMCVVRAGCSIKQQIPWFRKDKCPTYSKYVQKRDRISNIIGTTNEWAFILFVFWFILMIFITFGFGVWKWIEIIKGFF